MWLQYILALLTGLVIWYSVHEKRKTYRMLDCLLDRVLSQEEITHSDVEEGEFSALVSKIKQIQKVLGTHVQNAEKEKEQVKSLVSNMSHQLKTPLMKKQVMIIWIPAWWSRRGAGWRSRMPISVFSPIVMWAVWKRNGRLSIRPEKPPA